MPDEAAPEIPLIYDKEEGNVNPNPYPHYIDLQWKVPSDNGQLIDVFQIVYYKVCIKLFYFYYYANIFDLKLQKNNFTVQYTDKWRPSRLS